MEQVPIFVINMARDVERMASMKAQLDNLGLRFERIEAVDGGQVTPAQKKQLYSDLWYRLIHGRSASAGEIGVGLSHRKIYGKMRDENIRRAIILEDDVSVLASFPDQLQEIESSTRDFDMVQLFSFREPERKLRTVPSWRFEIMTYKSYHASSAAYLLRLKGAEKLLRFNKVRMLSDRWCWMSALTGLKCCAVWPFPIQLHETLAEVSSVGRINAEATPQRPPKSMAWRYLVFPWLNIVKLGILRVRGL